MCNIGAATFHGQTDGSSSSLQKTFRNHASPETMRDTGSKPAGSLIGSPDPGKIVFDRHNSSTLVIHRVPYGSADRQYLTAAEWVAAMFRMRKRGWFPSQRRCFCFERGGGRLQSLRAFPVDMKRPPGLPGRSASFNRKPILLVQLRKTPAQPVCSSSRRYGIPEGQTFIPGREPDGWRY